MSLFVKPLREPSAATEAARRSTLLRRQSLATPQARAVGAAVHFTRIEGSGGLSLLGTPPKIWLAPLAGLHGCKVAGLAGHDPLRRIGPRLDLLTCPALRAALNRLARPAIAGHTLLHGDFHLGQVILDHAGTPWIIDLDDLCLGPPEADLGNLIANLATQPGPPGRVAGRLDHWRRALIADWAHLAPPVRPAIVDHFTALALIRRHLKLRARARPDLEAEIAPWVTRVACRTSPSDSATCPG